MTFIDGTPIVISEIRARIAKRLADAGVDNAQAEARFICEAARDLTEVEEMATRRIAREPLSQILGTQPFWTLDLKVTPDVLTPRADTETLVEEALKRLPEKGRDYSIVDLGTGSGAILLALLRERLNAAGLGIDSSKAALSIAKENAMRCKLTDRCELRFGNWADGLPNDSFDLAVSNPPYIATDVLAGLEPEVRDHEPHLALDGGADGLDVYHTLISELFRIVCTGGHALVEIGFDQAEPVQALFEAAGFVDVLMVRDLAGNPRVVSGHKAAKD